MRRNPVQLTESIASSSSLSSWVGLESGSRNWVLFCFLDVGSSESELVVS